MKVDLRMKPPQGFDFAELSIDEGKPEIICIPGIFSDDGRLKLFEDIVEEIKQSECRKSFCFSSDRILEAASEYFIVNEPCEFERHQYSGRMKKWLEMDDKLYCAIEKKGDIETVVHELIHAGHGYQDYKSVMEFEGDKQSYTDLENAINTATRIFLKYIPRLHLEIRDAQIGKVMRKMDKYRMKDYFKTPENSDHHLYFFRDYIPKLKKSWEKHSAQESFDFNGIFNNYYWDEIREVLLNGNFEPPKRQRFLFMKINTVIEGCNGEDRTLNYIGYNLFIPENALVLKIMGFDDCFFFSGSDFNLFHLQSINMKLKGGYLINPEKLKFDLTVPRSLVTDLGNIYMNSQVFEGHHYYVRN